MDVTTHRARPWNPTSSSRRTEEHGTSRQTRPEIAAILRCKDSAQPVPSWRLACASMRRHSLVGEIHAGSAHSEAGTGVAIQARQAGKKKRTGVVQLRECRRWLGSISAVDAQAGRDGRGADGDCAFPAREGEGGLTLMKETQVTRVNEPDFLHDGQVLGRYQIVRLVGQGAMGAVYEAVHLVLRKRFAIKTLLPSIARLPEARARFLLEGEAASRVSHPNVVAVSDVGTENDMPYLVMEFLEGRSLADLLAARPYMSVEDAVDVLLPVISAVSFGHDMGVVHRDLKPQNIFLARAGWGTPVPKVLDFGVSKMTGGDSAALTGTLAVFGTAAYMSPEQARGTRDVDGQSDQYAIGLVLYEMLTERRAHPGDTPLEVIHNIGALAVVPPNRIRADLPNDLVAVLMRMLEMAPKDRYPSLRSVGRALLPFASALTQGAMREAFSDAASSAPDTDPPAACEARRRLQRYQHKDR